MIAMQKISFAALYQWRAVMGHYIIPAHMRDLECRVGGRDARDLAAKREQVQAGMNTALANPLAALAGKVAATSLLTAAAAALARYSPIPAQVRPEL